MKYSQPAFGGSGRSSGRKFSNFCFAVQFRSKTPTRCRSARTGEPLGPANKKGFAEGTSVGTALGAMLCESPTTCACAHPRVSKKKNKKNAKGSRNGKKQSHDSQAHNLSYQCLRTHASPKTWIQREKPPCPTGVVNVLLRYFLETQPFTSPLRDCEEQFQSSLVNVSFVVENNLI